MFQSVLQAFCVKLYVHSLVDKLKKSDDTSISDSLILFNLRDAYIQCSELEGRNNDSSCGDNVRYTVILLLRNNCQSVPNPTF